MKNHAKRAAKYFGQESRAGVAILFLVKKAGETQEITIHYKDIGEYLSREEKLNILSQQRLATTDWAIIEPNEHGDWINQRNESFQNLMPLSQEEDASTTEIASAPVFRLQTPGLKTNRDSWCYNSSDIRLRENISQSVSFYNGILREFQKTNPTGSLTTLMEEAKNFCSANPGLFHWEQTNYRHLANGQLYNVDNEGFVESCYRPFYKQRLYMNREFNTRIRKFPELYPNQGVDNIGISVVSPGSNNPFHTLMTNSIPDSELTSHTIYLPRWRYIQPQRLMESPRTDSLELERVSNIYPEAVKRFRRHYNDPAIEEDNLFYYIYGVLHSQQWRDTFADDLSKTQARIPMAATVEDFRAFVRAGTELGDLHVNYETAEPYPLIEEHQSDWNPENPEAYRVTKMTYLGPSRIPDKSGIVCNANITLRGIPDQAHLYQLGSRSALDWVIERYQVTTDTKSGFTNDPNDWATEHGDPRYIIDLIKRVTTVSIRTVEIAQGLPELPI